MINYPLSELGFYHIRFVKSARLMNGHDLEGLPGRETLAFPDETVHFDDLESASEVARQFADALAPLGIKAPEMEIVEMADGSVLSRHDPLPLLRRLKI